MQLHEGEYIPDEVIVKLRDPAISAKLLNNTPATEKAESFDEVFKRLGGIEKKSLFHKRSSKARFQSPAFAGKQGKEINQDRFHRLRFSQPNNLKSVIETLRNNPAVEYAEPNYIRRLNDTTQPSSATNSERADNTGHITALPSQSSDPFYQNQWHLEAINAPAAWQFLESHNINPGGSSDVIVAVIDTGVDYNHPDLAGNMWTNTGEIPGNGIDDDGNGFADDVHGANVVSNTNYHTGNPMDDNGHGTHVAGIACAQGNNSLGGVGVAYNTRIMAIKAAQYNGVLTSTDIAEAILYAVDKGADVINMSFGGYGQSQVEEEALAVAYGQTVLVAAAGNDGQFNEPIGDASGKAMYPAAYPWVLGIMAAERPASPGAAWTLALFSNKDAIPQNNLEYELMAPGVGIYSTLPNNTYAAWSGTSMATPVVSGIAALLRSYFADKDMYPSRFIMGQIAATGQVNSNYHKADALAALTVLPQPNLSYLDYWLFDNTSIAAVNDADGRVDAGETVNLAVSIRNHWGKADNVQVTLEPVTGGTNTPDPYVTMVVPTVDYGAVGSFNTDDNGLIYDAQGVITGVQHPFTFAVSADCPNDHIVHFKVTMTCKNGYDSEQPSLSFTDDISLIVQRGKELPRIITQNMELTKDDLWIISGQTLISAGVTVTVKEGTNIQWGTAAPKDPYSTPTEALLRVEGTLLVQGTLQEPVNLYPTSITTTAYASSFGLPYTYIDNYGRTELAYARIMDPKLSRIAGATGRLTSIDHAFIYRNDQRATPTFTINTASLTNSIVRLKKLSQESNSWTSTFSIGNIDTCLLDSSRLYIGSDSLGVNMKNSVVLQDNQYNKPTNWVFAGNYFSSEQQAAASQNIINNALLSKYWDPDINHWLKIFTYYPGRDKYFGMPNNFWGTTSTTLIDATIKDTNDDFTLANIIYKPFLTTPPATAFPFVADVQLTKASGASSAIFGQEPMFVTVTYNRDMNTAMQPSVSFGPDLPITDYTIHPLNGGWLDARTWKGMFNITSTTGDGYQLLRIYGGQAASDPWLVAGEDAGRFRFEIITSGTESMNLQATGGEGYIDLMWTQDSYDLLAGFNMYRSTSLNGSYLRLNAALLPPDQRSYRDATVQPGQQYYYKFKVVQSDLSESDFSNAATATPTDTIPPVISHAALTSAAPGLPLTISTDVTDNNQIQTTILYYRKMGQTAYATKGMVNASGARYSATLEGALLTSPGIEYYIEAFDGISKVTSGRADQPWQITVIDKPVITAVSPSSGPSTGGTAITLSGSNFKTGAAVRMGEAACSNINVVSSNQISVTTPAHFPETVDVEVVNTDTQSSLLARGFTFTSNAVSASMPELTGEQHQIVQVPISLTNVTGLASADLTISFDPAVLQARGATAASLASGWPLAVNTGNTGQIRLSMASSGGTVTGSGAFVTLEFEAIGVPGSSSPLTFTALTLNDGAIPAETVNSQFSVGMVYSVSGAVQYWNGGTAIPDVSMIAIGDRTFTGTSQANGAYTVGSLPPRDYSLTPTKTDAIAGISAYDASLVLRHAAGLQTLLGNAAIAADVNKSASITSMDAFYILQKSVDLISLPFNGAGRIWEFTPSSYNYTNLSANLSNQNFTGILLGDVSGNWNVSAEPAIMAQGKAARQTAAGSTTLQAATINILPGQENIASLSVTANTQSLNAIDLILTYDPLVVEPVAVNPGSLIPGWLVAANMSEPGIMKIGLAGANPIANNTGELLAITLKAKGPAGSSSTLAFTQAIADEGEKPLTALPGNISIVNGFTLDYSAGNHGTLLGSSHQVVPEHGDGSAMQAIPENGYFFVEWSDGTYANPRQDLNIIANIAVSATFDEGVDLDGDIDGSGTVDLKDAICGLKLITNAPQNVVLNKGADINHDRKIGMAEIISVLQTVAAH